MSEMDIREYKDYAKKHNGPKSINDSMLKTMDRCTNGRKLNSKDWDNINVKIKIAQVNEELHG